jgi:hypothetical protein
MGTLLIFISFVAAGAALIILGAALIAAKDNLESSNPYTKDDEP